MATEYRHINSGTRPCPLCTGIARAEEHRDSIADLSDIALMAMAEAIAEILREREEQEDADAGDLWTVAPNRTFPWPDDEVGVER